MEQATPFLQYVNILLSGATLLALIGAAVAYGRLIQKVETHEAQIQSLWNAQKSLDDRLYKAATHGDGR